MFDYAKWCDQQAAAVESALRRAAAEGRFDLAVYFTPARGAVAGRLTVASEADKPADVTDVLSFPGIGSRVSSLPYSRLHSAIFDACRRMPIIPTN